MPDQGQPAYLKPRRNGDDSDAVASEDAESAEVSTGEESEPVEKGSRKS
jgi:hypothetical protein